MIGFFYLVEKDPGGTGESREKKKSTSKSNAGYYPLVVQAGPLDIIFKSIHGYMALGSSTTRPQKLSICFSEIHKDGDRLFTGTRVFHILHGRS